MPTEETPKPPAGMGPIRIRGARQHNLRNIDLDLPRRALTVVTGPSGSGKSSLAFDTLFAEGQRRYVESLSTYAKQFLERMEKPDVDSVEGISPAVAIERKNPARSSRSTVGTATEVYDYMRLLWARVGTTRCPECGRDVRPDTVTGAVDRVLELPEGTRVMVTFPLSRSERTTHALLVEKLRSLGFVRVLADGEVRDLGAAGADAPESAGGDLAAAKELLVVVDRLTVSPDDRERLADSVGTCFRDGEGEAVVLAFGARGKSAEGVGAGGAGPSGKGTTAAAPERLEFTERFRCPRHPDIDFPEPTPQFFSFNSPYGSCPLCTGFGATLEYDAELIIPNPERSLEEGVVDPWSKPRYIKERKKLREFAESCGVSMHAPWSALPPAFRDAVLYGTAGPAKRGKKADARFDADREDVAAATSGDGEASPAVDYPKFKGIVPFLVSREKKRYKQYIRVFLRQYQSPVVCRVCHGSRLRPEALNVKVAGEDIGGVSELPLEELQRWLDALELEGAAAEIAETILRELRARVSFLVEVGLGYVTLSRQARTLSGGEAQRINLANSLGSSLVDALYVLDEPTVGLHAVDTTKLLELLARLRDAGNTVIVVEHDALAIRFADHVVELGPGSGEEGGEIVFEGEPDELERADTVTGRYLSGRSELSLPDRHRRVDGPSLRLEGATLHNLHDVDLEIPLGTLTAVTGVSGSGKSTLVHDVLYRALEKELGNGETSAKEHLGEAIGSYTLLEGAHRLEAVVLVDQSPIGRTPRSNPVTYIKAWDEVRKIFADLPLARKRRYSPGHFSFNVAGGRCEACKGAGHVEIEMIFMADVYVPCDVCRGTRFRPEVLEVEYKGMNVSQVLELTVDRAIRFFLKEDRLGKTLWHLQRVGLGYLRLGQAATTLSGGEAQRLKIARELSGAAGKKGRKLYLLDEPTTGLAGEDVRKLLQVLDHLVEAGNTVLVVEHNLDVVRAADWVVDLGPGGGHLGGRIVAAGRPEDVASVPGSMTGRYLREMLEGVGA